MEHQDLHAHVAVQLVVGLNGRLELGFSGDETLTCDAVVLGPMVAHRVYPSSTRALLLYADPRGRLGRALRRLSADGVAPVPQLRALIRRLVQEGAPAEQFVTALLQEIGPPTSAADKRLGSLLAVADGSQGDPLSMRDLASRSGLSNSGFRELAKRALGVPPARYALWRKLEYALRAVTDGESLAAAAHIGGFADQAHLARTMRRMFGVTASELIALRLAHRSH
ncbi:MAG: helix-turn-helix domain-containing protein [Rhizorhabdus sp.]|nr:helix-turn-helix domain-containing protein [Rhizorhabdus sp.]